MLKVSTPVTCVCVCVCGGGGAAHTMSRMGGGGGGGGALVVTHCFISTIFSCCRFHPLPVINDWSLSLATDKINQDVMINTLSVVVNHT